VESRATGAHGAIDWHTPGAHGEPQGACRCCSAGEGLGCVRPDEDADDWLAVPGAVAPTGIAPMPGIAPALAAVPRIGHAYALLTSIRLANARLRTRAMNREARRMVRITLSIPWLASKRQGE
jgi:hypothetical protein